MADLRDIWEATSFELEKLQANPGCVAQEQEGLKLRKSAPYDLTFDAEPLPIQRPMGLSYNCLLDLVAF